MLTHERLTNLLDYDPEAGTFVRLNDPESVVGCQNSAGYWQTRIDGKDYYLHRLAWFFVHGEMPPGILDHANGDKSDNRIQNLRLATKQLNAANSRLAADNTSGVKGVGFHRASKKWRAYVGNKHLGLFETMEEAITVRLEAAKAEYGEFYRAA